MAWLRSNSTETAIVKSIYGIQFSVYFLRIACLVPGTNLTLLFPNLVPSSSVRREVVKETCVPIPILQPLGSAPLHPIYFLLL